jgi:hypothetical protein
MNDSTTYRSHSLSSSFVPSVDAESEHLVQAAIDGMIARGKATKDSKSMTVIIVARKCVPKL